MTREELIKKWLDDDLNPKELEAFKAFDDYDDLVKLTTHVTRFHTPEYNTEEELKLVLQKLEPKSAVKRTWFKPLIGIAATLTLFFAFYVIMSLKPKTVQTFASEKTEIILPDASNASLNALSSLSYNETKWTENREVRLDGEAFFKVAKGSKFNVITKDGTVTVLGTQFNVKQRNSIFEVVCYEGLVGVTHNGVTIKLKAGESYLILEGKLIAKEKELKSVPTWLQNESHFKSMPFSEVIAEFERQYNKTIELEDVDTSQLFTGKFVHDDFNMAIKAISLPLNLNYSLKDQSTLLLSRE